jgi:hypothetical protein
MRLTVLRPSLSTGRTKPGIVSDDLVTRKLVSATVLAKFRDQVTV